MTTDTHKNSSSASVVSDSPNQSNETRVVIEYGERPYVVKQGEREIKRFARCDEANQFVSVRRIARHETTQRSAEIYQNRLYNRFDSVRLVDWPRFASTGTFIWEVSQPSSD